ncbi:hypothetical protein ACH5RR_032616 [Cinchona calisaya]|uniref:Uncharacterized protein n=1 Tax=Cinchona calisaya TaxID=153742 RepID=A0ABD2YMT1_9GENT
MLYSILPPIPVVLALIHLEIDAITPLIHLEIDANNLLCGNLLFDHLLKSAPNLEVLVLTMRILGVFILHHCTYLTLKYHSMKIIGLTEPPLPSIWVMSCKKDRTVNA